MEPGEHPVEDGRRCHVQSAQAALEISDWTYVLASRTVKISAASQALLSRDDLGEVLLSRSI
jgi:ABC-type branched-subunit amino acid transport system ATPase component